MVNSCEFGRNCGMRRNLGEIRVTIWGVVDARSLHEMLFKAIRVTPNGLDDFLKDDIGGDMFLAVEQLVELRLKMEHPTSNFVEDTLSSMMPSICPVYTITECQTVLESHRSIATGSSFGRFGSVRLGFKLASSSFASPVRIHLFSLATLWLKPLS